MYASECRSGLCSFRMFPGGPALYRSTSRSTNRASCTDSEIVAVSLGDGRIGYPRSRIAATMQAAMTRTPFSRCLSMPESIGEFDVPTINSSGVDGHIAYATDKKPAAFL